jgi:predicted MFS family arabinose efflux permease
LALSAVRAARHNKALQLFQLARLASVTGRWAYTVTLAVYAYRSGGAYAVALAALVRLGPAALASPFSGELLARGRVGTLLLKAGLLRSAVLATAGLLALLVEPSWPVYVCVAAESAVSAVMRPAQQSLLPRLAQTPEELTTTNLALSVIESLGVLIGPLCGAALLHLTTVGTVFLVAAGAYLVSALLLLPVSLDDAGPVVLRVRERRSFVSEALGGLRVVAADRDARVVLILYGAQNLIAGALNVLIVVTALRLLDLGQTGVGTLTAALGIGGVIGGGLVLARLPRRRHGADLAIGLALWGIPLVALAATSSEVVALLMLALVGVGVTVVDVAAVTLLQRAAADDVLGHALGLLQSILVTTVGIGTLVAPALIDWLGVRGALLAAGVPLPLLATSLWKRLNRLDAGTKSTSRWSALIAANSIFAPLSVVARDEIASQMVELPMHATDLVIEQGGRGDAFFLIGSGEVEVEQDGRLVAELGPGSGFGEIALLRDIPRTATVRAKTDGTLLRLERDPFLAVVTGNRFTAQAAESLVGARLGFGGVVG